MKNFFLLAWAIVLLPLIGFSQDKPLKGKVVDDSTGQGLPNVSVAVVGSNRGTNTDGNGIFSLRVPSAAAKTQLRISSVGYTTFTITVTDGINGDIRLKKEDKTLEDVVVIGYGTQKQRNLTGSVSTFDTKSIQEKPIARIDQAMIGQMAGVQVKQQTGLPGQGFSIVVRGVGSISGGTEPLYVVDGFPLDVVSQSSSGGFTANPLNNLNANDIESIQVLKDAAAAAIYGSRAANGVVLITTKRGQVGKTKINVNAYTGTSKVAKKMDVLSAQEWIAQSTELANYKWVASGAGRTADQTNDQRRTILGLAPGAYNVTYMNDDRWAQPGHPGLRFVDWQDEVFRNAPFQNYEVSASGGTESVRYFFSGNYLNQDGVLLNSGYKNYSARANVEVNANKRLKIGLNLSPSYSETKVPSAEGKDNQLMKLFNMTPVVEDTAGLLSGAGKNSVYQWASSSVSPVAFLNNTIGINKTTRYLISLYGELQIINGLSLRSTINYDEANQNTKRYTSDFVAGNIANYLTSPGKSSSGSYAGFKKQNFVNENTINYNRVFKEDHSLSVVAGMSYSGTHIENFTISTAGGFANDIVTTLNGAIASTAGVTVTGNTTESNNTLLSYYGRLQYSYMSKYLLSASLRRDASSRFGIDNRWGTFPSVSVGWRLSDERFMKSISFINDLKLRFSYGKSGSSNISDYGSIPVLGAANYSFGGNAPLVATGQVPTGVPNPELHWETSNTYGAGFDASLFASRINITFDVYQKKSTDLFLNIPILANSGFNSSLQNIGSVNNKGLEIGLNTFNIRKRNFQWTSNANIAFNKNAVEKLGIDGAPINVPTGYGGNPPYLLQIGLPMYSYFLVQTQGVLSADDIANPKIAKLSGQAVGDAKYLDADANGKIDANDRVITGRPYPKFTWGFTNNFRYKNLDLSIQMYGQHGGQIYSFLARAIDNPANGRNTTLGIWRDRWTASNQNYNAPRGKIGESYTIPLFTTDWLYSSDFWRVQNITLGYNLKSLVKSNVLNGARIYASVQNWFGHDNYAGGVNPEAQNTNVSGSGSYPIPGDYGAMPLNKTITVGINLTF
jgi:TonB-linked SusC/RagA family outer membrane protein